MSGLRIGASLTGAADGRGAAGGSYAERIASDPAHFRRASRASRALASCAQR